LIILELYSLLPRDWSKDKRPMHDDWEVGLCFYKVSSTFISLNEDETLESDTIREESAKDFLKLLKTPSFIKYLILYSNI